MRCRRFGYRIWVRAFGRWRGFQPIPYVLIAIAVYVFARLT